MSLGPRTLLDRRVEREPADRGAVDRRDDVAGEEACPLGRRIVDGRHDVIRQSGPSVGQLSSPTRSCVPIVGADALELAAEDLARLPEVVRAHVRGVRVAERLDHPVDRAFDELLPVDLPDVALGDRVPDVPERPEELGLGGRRARRRRRPGPEREAGQEERGACEERDDARARWRAPPGRGRPRAGAAGSGGAPPGADETTGSTVSAERRARAARLRAPAAAGSVAVVASSAGAGSGATSSRGSTAAPSGGSVIGVLEGEGAAGARGRSVHRRPDPGPRPSSGPRPARALAGYRTR